MNAFTLIFDHKKHRSRHHICHLMMHSSENIGENRFFGNGGPNLHIKKIAQGFHEDNQPKILQETHKIANPPKKLRL